MHLFTEEDKPCMENLNVYFFPPKLLQRLAGVLKLTVNTQREVSRPCQIQWLHSLKWVGPWWHNKNQTKQPSCRNISSNILNVHTQPGGESISWVLKCVAFIRTGSSSFKKTWINVGILSNIHNVLRLWSYNGIFEYHDFFHRDVWCFGCVCVPPGFNAETLPLYAKRSQRMVITARKLTPTFQHQLSPDYWKTLIWPTCDFPLCIYCYYEAPVTNPPVTPKALTAGHKRSHPAYIPSHFPEFPDPHTYIKTPVSQNCFSFSYRKHPSIAFLLFCST